MNTKLIKLLKTLTDDELKMFGKFIKSPYFNTVKNLCKLYSELIKFHPSYSSGLLTNELLHKKLFNGKPFNRQVMWNLSSKLEGQLKDFLQHQELRKKPFWGTKLRLSAFARKGTVNLFKGGLGDMETWLKDSKIDYDFFENSMHLENYKQDYFHMTDNIRKMGDSKKLASEYLVLLFLRMAAGSLNDLKLLDDNHNYRPKFALLNCFVQKIDLSSFVDYCKTAGFEYSFLVELYYHSIMLLLDPRSPEHLFKIKKIFQSGYNKFATGEKRSIMHWIANYCFENLDADENRYRLIAFEINKLRLKDGLVFYPENQLPSAMFLQIFNNALALKKFDWARRFLNNYSVYLNPSLRNALTALANAMLSFSSGDFVNTLNWLNKADVTGIQDKFYVRTLSARCYYELNETESLFSYIDSSLHFLRANKLVTKKGRIYLQNFFNSLKKIQVIKENEDIKAAELLKIKISGIEEISNKQWLLTKLGELERG